MEYEIQYARLATNEKLPDRFLNTQLKANADLAKTQMGEVFTVVEIMTPWFTTAQIGQTIINTFTTSYWQGGSTSDLANFEEALQKVNQTLGQITQNGETDWIGNLNAILGVVVQNKMHLAQAGKSRAYIFRDGKIEDLTEGLTQEGKPHPLKTFINITSGELKNHDKILLANPEIYNAIEMESLRQIITMNSPAEAVMQIAKILKRKKISAINALIINLLTSEELAKMPVETEESTVFLDRPLESVWSAFRKFWQQLMFPVLKSIGRSTKNSAKTATDKSLKFTKNYISTLQEKRTQRATQSPEKPQEPVKKRDLFEKEFIDSGSDDLLNDEEIKYSPELDVHYYQEKQKDQSSTKVRILEPVFDNVKKFFLFIWKFFQNKKTRPFFLVISAVILLLIVGLVYRSVKNNNNDPGFDLNEAQSVLKKAEDNQQAAKQAVLSNDNEKAKQLCAGAIEQVKPIMGYAVVGDDAKKVVTACNSQIDQLTATTRFDNLSPLVTVEGAKTIFINSGTAYIATSSAVYKSLITGGKPSKVASIPGGSGDITFGVPINDIVYLYTSSQKVYAFSTANDKLDLASVNGNLETANTGSTYIGNLYLLDSVIGQIYKHPLTSGNFGAGTAYLSGSSVNIKNSKSLAIDGSLYVLLSDGTVLELTKGKLQDFTISNTPTPYSKIDGPVKIFTDADTPSIYILDNSQKRILSYDKKGNYEKQFALPSNIGELTDMVVSVKSNKIWVLGGINVYEISI